VDFEGSGYKGFEFELKGYQERNVETLLKTLSTKEAQTTIKELAKIEKDSWKQMGLIMLSLKEISVNGLAGFTDIGVGEDLINSLKDTLTTQINSAIAPLKNELIAMINTLLSPIMPFLEQAINELSSLISRGTGAIQALIEGRFDEWLRQEQLRLTPDVENWNVRWTETYYETLYVLARDNPNIQYYQDLFYQSFHMTVAEYEALQASGQAGGTMSGQFDIDLDALQNMIDNMNLDQFFDEEEE
jgi:hypothetical protein